MTDEEIYSLENFAEVKDNLLKVARRAQYFKGKGSNGFESAQIVAPKKIWFTIDGGPLSDNRDLYCASEKQNVDMVFDILVEGVPRVIKTDFTKQMAQMKLQPFLKKLCKDKDLKTAAAKVDRSNFELALNIVYLRAIHSSIPQATRSVESR